MDLKIILVKPMLSNHRMLNISLIFLIWTQLLHSERALCQSPSSSTQAPRKYQSSWKRIHPESWFSISVPRKKYETINAVDANAKTYISTNLKINYIYWLRGNTPHFIQWERDNKKLVKPDPNTKLVFTKRIRVGQYRGTLNKYKVLSNSQVEYLWDVQFAQVKVEESGMKGLGEFALSVSYVEPHTESIARDIIKSLRF